MMRGGDIFLTYCARNVLENERDCRAAWLLPSTSQNFYTIDIVLEPLAFFLLLLIVL